MSTTCGLPKNLPRAASLSECHWPPRGGGRPSSETCSAAGRPDLARLAGARRALVGSARALAAAALLALSGALALPATAEAQTVIDLVSNVDVGNHTGYHSTNKCSQRFTVGSNPSGYTLTGVDVVSATPTAFTVELCETASGAPTSPCTTLSPPSSFGVGTMSYTLPAATTLEQGKTYSVKTNTHTDGWQGFTTADGDSTEDTADGWSIEDACDIQSATFADTWIPMPGSQALRIAIKGYALGRDDATLSGLSVSGQQGANPLVTFDLSPAFDPGIETYSVSVSENYTQVTFMPATNHDDATVAYFDGVDMELVDASASTADHQVYIAVGPNTVKVKVTAPDGMTEKTYTVIVTRDRPTLTAATVPAGGTPVALQWGSAFPTGTGTLSAAAVAAFTVTADGVERQITGIVQELTDNLLNVTLSTPIYKDQAVVVSYDSAAAGTAALVSSQGHEYLSFTTGQDGVPAAANNSTVVASTDATLSDLTVTAGGTNLVTFASGTFDYSAMVGTAVAVVTVTATKTETNATIEYLDRSDAMLDDADTGTAGHQVALAVGDTVIQVKVTAQNTTTTQIYMVTVNREAPPGPPAPTNFVAKPGNGQVVLSWDAPAPDSGVMRHEYQFETDGSYGTWTRIANSAVGSTNQAGFTVTGLTNEVPHTFQLRVVSADGDGAEAMAGPVTPTPGICDRTQQVRDEILRQLSPAVSDCAAVTVADLESVPGLALDDKSIMSLKADDFAGLTSVTLIDLGYNQLGALPGNLFSGLTKLQTLYIPESGVTTLPADAFSGLTALARLFLDGNPSLGSLPATSSPGSRVLYEQVLVREHRGLSTVVGAALWG